MRGNSLWFSQENHLVEEVPVKGECFGLIAETLVCTSLRTRIKQYLLLFNQFDLEMFRVILQVFEKFLEQLWGGYAGLP